MHSNWPWDDENFPGEQLEQMELPTLLNVPDGQLIQALSPGNAENLPASHGMQALNVAAPVMLTKVPGRLAVQAVIPKVSAKEPTGQSLQ